MHGLSVVCVFLVVGQWLVESLPPLIVDHYFLMDGNFHAPEIIQYTYISNKYISYALYTYRRLVN